MFTVKHLSSKNIAFTAVFASLYYIMSYLPGIPAIGVPDVKVQLEACMASVFGLILGPYLGALATSLGVFVAWALPPGSMSPQSLIFLLAFISNEVDNAWGNNIFAVPQVYEGLFKMTLEAVRWAFLISPYAYFIIRLIQVVIAALIALPLTHNLRASEFGLICQPRKTG